MKKEVTQIWSPEREKQTILQFTAERSGHFKWLLLKKPREINGPQMHRYHYHFSISNLFLIKFIFSGFTFQQI